MSRLPDLLAPDLLLINAPIQPAEDLVRPVEEMLGGAHPVIFIITAFFIQDMIDLALVDNFDRGCRSKALKVGRRVSVPMLTHCVTAEKRMGNSW